MPRRIRRRESGKCTFSRWHVVGWKDGVDFQKYEHQPCQESRIRSGHHSQRLHDDHGCSSWSRTAQMLVHRLIQTTITVEENYNHGRKIIAKIMNGAIYRQAGMLSGILNIQTGFLHLLLSVLISQICLQNNFRPSLGQVAVNLNV